MDFSTHFFPVKAIGVLIQFLIKGGAPCPVAPPVPPQVVFSDKIFGIKSSRFFKRWFRQTSRSKGTCKTYLQQPNQTLQINLPRGVQMWCPCLNTTHITRNFADQILQSVEQECRFLFLAFMPTIRTRWNSLVLTSFTTWNSMVPTILKTWNSLAAHIQIGHLYSRL